MQGASNDLLAHEKPNHHTSNSRNCVTARELRREQRIFRTLATKANTNADCAEQGNGNSGAGPTDVEYNGTHTEFCQNTTRHL